MSTLDVPASTTGVAPRRFLDPRWRDRSRDHARGAVLPATTHPRSAIAAIPSRDPSPGITAGLRISLLLLIVVVLLTSPRSRLDLLWVLPLGVTELWVHGRELRPRGLAALAYWWAAVSATGVFFTGGSHSALLPGILVGTFLAGLALGTDGVLAASGLASTLLLGIWAIGYDTLDEPSQQYLGTCAEWVVLGVGVGMAGEWIGRRQSGPEAQAAERYAEARDLLNQLRAVTQHLPGSLDVTTTCELLLESCLTWCNASTGAVLMHGGGGNLVPIVLRGARRVPWRSPTAGTGPLQQAWESGLPTLDLRPADAGLTPSERFGNRQGSAVLAVPIITPDAVLGLVVLQTRPEDAPTADTIAQVRSTVEAYTVRLETAQLFDEVRAAATVEERSRLAHDMHDGVAQDLAYIGFELDLLRSQAAQADPALAQSVAVLRQQTTTIISEIRGSITDLRSSRSIERGLGAALSSYVRNAGTAGQLSVHLTLDESAFRLPAQVEVELLRLVQEFTTVAATDARAQNLWVTLVVEPPAASLQLTHDGQETGVGHGVTGALHRLQGLGADVVDDRRVNGRSVGVSLGGERTS